MLLRSVTTREVEWDPDQQALILALDLLRRQTCEQCGGHLPDTTDPANEEAYEAVGPFLCYSCEAVGDSRDALVKNRTSNNAKVPHNLNRWKTRRKG